MNDVGQATKAKARTKGRKRTWLRRALLVVLGVVTVVGLVLAWLPNPVPVEMAPVAKGPLQVVVEEDGRTRVKDRFVVSAPVAGTLDRIELDAGDTVKRGDVLARIAPLGAPLLDPRSRSTAAAQVAAAAAAVPRERAQIERARAAAEFAKKEEQRFEGLFQGGAVSEAELDQKRLEARTRAAEVASAEFALKVAQHELEMAKAALQQTSPQAARSDSEAITLRSPIDGVVLKVMQESEGAVQGGTPLLELGDPARLEVVVDLLTSDAVDVDLGAPARIEHWGGPPLEARVRRIEPSAFTRLSALGVEEQRVNVLLDLQDPRKQWQALGDGYRVEAAIVTWEGRDVLQVPASAIFRQGEQWALFVVEDGRAALRTVEVGHRTGAQVQILKGVEPGAEVVVHPSDRVVSGTRVTPR